ncbi:hypothetical protein ACMD2_03693 [Ananas comosus]|uniref:Aldehyde oxidase GLOX-like n=1 Tax=Ananas comosus TaxID=4615 RepID=A0A199UJG8_ANACO|nr:hypothetical protein ACMD2_03693 [Ananas comosus]
MTILIPRTTTTTTILFFFFFLFFYGGGGEGTGEGGGEWRLLHESIGISAMHMQLLPGDKVVMFDRTDFGPSNISLLPFHPCRRLLPPSPDAVDCTAHSVLLDLPTNAITPLLLLTDPWCSSAALLPNGTLLQSGGFNSGDRSLRLLTPPFSALPRWLELPGALSVRRWYAANQILPDGRVVILGGRRQFNYEFFPRASDRELYEFPFLEETRDADDENNLYPFLHLLPDGGLFVFANNRSVSPARGEVLVCGGAPRGAYAWARRGAAFLPAERTCGRIAATEAGAAWSVEAMPGPRVMGDMVLLPTGDVLVVNGAAAGTAGWESARDPVLRPALYRPERELGARFEEMARAGRARLYHAAATLDSYGRVLVGGGNPHAGYVFDGVEYPTELSLEAFLPPYLHPGRDGARPRAAAVVARGGGAAAAAAVGGVGYGEVVGVRFRVGVGDGDGGAEMEEGEEVRVVAVAPGFATHAVGMNQRVVGMGVGRVERISPPAPAPAEYEAEVAAPPSPEVAPPGYYLWFVVHAGVPSDRGVWVRIGYPGDLS